MKLNQTLSAIRKMTVAGMTGAACILLTSDALAQKKMEYLDRALVAVKNDAGQVYLGWRFRATDTGNVAFNVYRGDTRINTSPVTTSTNFVDATPDLNATYKVRAILNGVELAAWDSATVWQTNRLEIPIQRPAAGSGYTYTANDCSAADLDGDGQYEIILKWDPSNAKDNSESGITGNVYIDAYKLNGTRLWRIDLGKNIRAGAHYTQFIAYDLNSDGKAEVACRTADGTIDGVGTVIGDSTVDHRNSNGYILKGPEWLTIFNGQTGAAMSSATFYPQRHPTVGDNPTTSQMNSIWGDNYGNRIDRFLAGVAYLDGVHPSLIMARGYYTRSVVTAWDWGNNTLKRRWVFDTNFDTTGTANTTYASYRGQGAHSLSIGDVDGDGKDEIIYGACAIDDNGRGLYTTGMGHGDALHMSDMNPDRPGQEVLMVHETQAAYGNNPMSFCDAATGQVIFGGPGPNRGDVGRGMAADIDPRTKGYEVWSILSGVGVFDCRGNNITTSRPSVNFAIWWDGDLLRELLDGTKITKWNWNTSSNSNTLLEATNFGCASNNTTKATPGLTADLLGDWREEVIWRKADESALVIFTTTAPTEHRLVTLMHDAQYREAVAWQNVAYNQPPHPSFYLGDSMATPPMPDIEIVGNPGWPPPYTAPVKVGAIKQEGHNLSIYPNPVHSSFVIDFKSASSTLKLQVTNVEGRILGIGSGTISSLNSTANKYLKEAPAGVYFVTIDEDGQRYTGRLVKL